MRDFSTVVAEERYVQDSHPMPHVDDIGPTRRVSQAAPQHVELQSDLLFVRPDPSGLWLTFRDVSTVNGRAVRDRADRLAKLFVGRPPDAPDAIDRAWEIARDGSRFNIGSKDRTVADPFVALAFLQAKYRQRFEFRVSSIDTTRGPDVWILKFKERGRPTILRTADDRNVLSSGRFWIDGESGRVLQTELETSVGDRVMTTFTFDERLGLDVPAEMRDIAWHDGTVMTGVATRTSAGSTSPRAKSSADSPEARLDGLLATSKNVLSEYSAATYRKADPFTPVVSIPQPGHSCLTGLSGRLSVQTVPSEQGDVGSAIARALTE